MPVLLGIIVCAAVVCCAAAWMWASRVVRRERARARKLGSKVLALQKAQANELLRFGYAQWWARNASECNTDESQRATLVELALLCMCCETMEEVANRVSNFLPTEQHSPRAVFLRAALEEWNLKRPKVLDGVSLETTDEPWRPWEKSDHERPGKPRHNPRALAWFVHELERGALAEQVRALEAAVGALAAGGGLELGGAIQAGASPVQARDYAVLGRWVERRIAGNSRPLPAFGQNP